MEKTNIFFKNIIITIIVLLITLYIIKVLDIAYPLTIVTTSKSTELSVVGEGRVEITPNAAYLTAGIVVDNKPNVKDVSREIDKINNKIINELKNFNINKKDIKTSNYSIYPNYKYENNENLISGYNGNVNIEIKIKDINKVASIIEIVTQAGANQIQGVRFSIDNPEKYREEARNLAIKNAKEQAEKIAKTLGIKLGKVVNIVESSPNQPVPYFAKTLAEKVRNGGPIIEAGTETITSIVTLYFEKK